MPRSLTSVMQGNLSSSSSPRNLRPKLMPPKAREVTSANWVGPFRCCDHTFSRF